MSGIVYFIQPVEHLNTNRFKIGCSTHSDLRRLKKYSEGTIYYLVIAVNEPFAVESRIKKSFNEKFTRFGTTETYEGEMSVMMGAFLLVVLPQYISEPDNNTPSPSASSKMSIMRGLFTRLFGQSVSNDPSVSPQATNLQALRSMRYTSNSQSPQSSQSPRSTQAVQSILPGDTSFHTWLRYFLTIFPSILLNISDKEIPPGTYRFQSKVLYEDYIQYTAHNKLSKNNFYKYLRDYCVDHTDVIYIKRYKGYPAYDFIKISPYVEDFIKISPYVEDFIKM